MSLSNGAEAGPSTPKAMEPRVPHNVPHPKFRPDYLPSGTPSVLDTAAERWVTPLAAPAYFSLDVFHSVLRELSLHPEQNSSLIIRADPLPLQAGDEDDSGVGARLGLETTNTVRLRFIPRQPKRDSRLEQRVFTYNTPEDAGGQRKGLVVKIPDAASAADLPYYHPAVRKLAFLYEETDPAGRVQGASGGADDAPPDQPRIYGRISVSYLPFADSPDQAPPSVFLVAPPKPVRKRSPLAGGGDAVPPPAVVLPPTTEEEQIEACKLAEKRLQRTCLALLEKLHKHGHGTATGYVKRVVHDVIVKREPFQDLYQALKERHKQLDSRKPQAWSTKVEDVKRHVWKDIAIAAFLMLLWRDMYPARSGPSITGMEWDAWGRPEGGFIDLGCGNGLLVHILITEGYHGKGYELRARRTWPEYPTATQEALVELAIDMPSWFPETMEQWDAGEWPGRESCIVKEGTFLIGNHSDELTPWIPLVSLLPRQPVPHLSLPCCHHTLDGSFTTLNYTPPAHPQTPEGGFEAGLEAGASRYKSYVMWLGWCGLRCGWQWEKEPLRIPSTRGWGIVARKRWTANAAEERACREWALSEVDGVRARGAFKVREKEGKDH